ncbi:HNH endonuclease signature motif containing protein [Escherichia coli]
MNYQDIYRSMMRRAIAERGQPAAFKAKRTDADRGYHRHHIKPRAFGGGDEGENIARLTAKEHRLAHLLAWRFTREDTYLAEAGFQAFVTHNVNPGSMNRYYLRFLERRFRAWEVHRETQHLYPTSMSALEYHCETQHLCPSYMSFVEHSLMLKRQGVAHV